jgi:hypothetical protein
MRYAQYLKAEKHISATDSGAIIERWRYGRRLLCDDAAMTASRKSLKHGVLDRLIAHAEAERIALSDQEIQRRLRAARAYPTEDQIRRAATDFDTWRDLVNAGFPEYDRADPEPDYDPRWTDERERDAVRIGETLAADGDREQLVLFDLFPEDRFDEMSTLDELAKWAEEMASMTERYARRDAKRLAYLGRLIDAVHGDMSATWAQARAALGETGGA